jgi:hypothetical protein
MSYLVSPIGDVDHLEVVETGDPDLLEFRWSERFRLTKLLYQDLEEHQEQLVEDLVERYRETLEKDLAKVLQDRRKSE